MFVFKIFFPMISNILRKSRFLTNDKMTRASCNLLVNLIRSIVLLQSRYDVRHSRTFILEGYIKPNGVDFL